MFLSKLAGRTLIGLQLVPLEPRVGDLPVAVAITTDPRWVPHFVAYPRQRRARRYWRGRIWHPTVASLTGEQVLHLVGGGMWRAPPTVAPPVASVTFTSTGPP